MNVCRLAVVFVIALPACSLARGPDGTPSTDVSRRRSLEYGMMALEDGDYRAAMGRIAPVAAICPTDELGRRAMLLLATAELDPRNPAGRPDAAAELAAFQLARRDAGEVEGAIAAHLYTVALDYGARPLTSSEIPDAGVIWTRYLSDGSGAEPLGADAADGVPPAAVVDQAERANEATARVERDVDGGPVCSVRRAHDDVVLPELTADPMALRSAPAQPQDTNRPAPAASGDTRELQAEVERLRAELDRKEQELDRIRRTLRP